MESWILEGDSYSFLHGAPHTFNLRNRDGPNRVEIYDITRIPSQRSAISETTCLCDIFGDDCESPSLSSSPSSATFIKREVHDHLPTVDTNDSSGSYHTAQGSEQMSDSSNRYEDPKELLSETHIDLLSYETKETDATLIPFITSSKDENQCLANPKESTLNVLSQKVNSQVSESKYAVLDPEFENTTTEQDVSKTHLTNIMDEIDATGLLSEKSTADLSCEVKDTSFRNELYETTSPAELQEISSSLEQMDPTPSSEKLHVRPTLGSKNTHLPEVMAFTHLTEQEREIVLSENRRMSAPELKGDLNFEFFSETESVSSSSEIRVTATSPENKGISAPVLAGTSEPGGTSACPSPKSLNAPVFINNEDHADYSDLKHTQGSPSPQHITFGSENVQIPTDIKGAAFPPNLGNISPLPENGKRVLSSELNELCLFPEFHGEPSVIVQSPLKNNVSSLPEIERGACLPEPTASPPPKTVGTGFPVCCQELSPDCQCSTSASDTKHICVTPESKNISPTTENKQISLSPVSMTFAETRSVTSSPVIKGIRCRIISQDSCGTAHLPEVNYSVASDLTEARDTVVSSAPNDVTLTNHIGMSSSSELCLTPAVDTVRISVSLPEATNQLYSKNRFTILSAEDDCTTSKESSCHMSFNIFERKTNPSLDPSGVGPCNHTELTDSFQHIDPVLAPELWRTDASNNPKEYKCTGHALALPNDQSHRSMDCMAEPLSTDLSLKTKDEDFTITAHMTDSIIFGDSNSPNHLVSSSTVKMALKEKDQKHMDENCSCTASEMFERESAGSRNKHDQMLLESRETPYVHHNDNSQEYDRQPCQDREKSGEREGEEEHASGKEKEKRGQGGYRGKQVELSFSARNRRGPASHSPVPRRRDPMSGIPAHCYSECLLATRQQQLRVQDSQKENRGGFNKIQNNNTGLHSTDYTSETSSMGSEIDEADNEVKWFTDLAFRSLSSPQLNYLDVNNSIHRSSTNISQPSTKDSPHAVAWLSYADLQDSTLLESDEFSPATFLSTDGQDSSKHFEIGSFECIDIALESREESREGKRTVPKRQIQLKHRSESKPLENTNIFKDSLSVQKLSKDTLFCQHSTPGVVQEDLYKENSDSKQMDQQQMLQKSLSLDESSAKTKMASCIIKSVLSKKMQDETKQTPRNEDSNLSEDKNKPSDSIQPSMERKSATTKKCILNSSLPSDCSISSEDAVITEQRSMQHDVKPHKKPPCNPRPIPAQGRTERSEPKAKNSRMDDTRFQLSVPLQSKKSDIQIPEGEKNKAFNHNLAEQCSSDSANASARNRSPSAIQDASMQCGMTNRDMECHMKPENHKQQSSRSVFMSTAPEIILKPCHAKDENKSSLRRSLCLDLERSEDSQESRLSGKYEDKVEPELEVETEISEDDERTKTTAPAHKVRDVRKLVRNTYNLSFKNSCTVTPVKNNIIPEGKEKLPLDNPCLQIECKSFSWKENKANQKENDTRSKMLLPHAVSERGRDSSDITTEDSGQYMPQSKISNVQATEICASVPHEFSGKSSDDIEFHSIKISSVPETLNREKEVSTLLFLQDSSSKSQDNIVLPPPPQLRATSCSNSVSMFLKEKGLQADIGVCDISNEKLIVTPKHINKLEVPLQNCPSEINLTEQRMEYREINTAKPADQLVSNSTPSLTNKDEPQFRISLKPVEQPGISPPPALTDIQRQTESPQLEKDLTETRVTHVCNLTGKAASPLASNNKQQCVEVKSFYSGTSNPTLRGTASKEVELPIQVRSISGDRPKTAILTKLSYKQRETERGSISGDSPKTDMPATFIYGQQASLVNEATTANKPILITKEQAAEAKSNNTKKSASLAVSSNNPPSCTVAKPSSPIRQLAMAASYNEGQVQTSSPDFIHMQELNMMGNQTCSTPDSSKGSTQPVILTGTQAPNYPQPVLTTPSKNQLHAETFHFFTSEDPPSYDERESFSPLMLSDLPTRRLNRYHPTMKQTPFPCTTSCYSHLGHPQHSIQNHAPSVVPTSQSPCQILSYQRASPQAQEHPHQCRPDDHPLRYLPHSPKTVRLSSVQAPAMIQTLHHKSSCPGQVMQPCGDSRQHQLSQHMERPAANHYSPKQQALSGAPCNEYSHSPNIHSFGHRPQFLCNQDLTTSFGHEYGGEGTVGGDILYHDSSSGIGYGQGPRRVLLDPETGKYFYIEVPMQPLRKMLFDPETGQYVEVLIPQQSISHSGLYPTSPAPYSSLHDASTCTQYLPYAMAPQIPQQTHHPDGPVSTSPHQTSMGFGSQAAQTEQQGNPTGEQSYLQGMYYIHTGSNTHPNTSSDCYHKPLPNQATSGGRR